MYIIGTLSYLDEKTLKKLDKESENGKQRRLANLHDYTTVDDQAGKKTEATVVALLTHCLSDVVSVKTTKRGSVGDDDYKIDVVVTTDKGVVGLQVKSSMHPAQKSWDVHGIASVWVDGTNPTCKQTLVKELAQFLGVQVHPDLKDGLRKLSSCKRRSVRLQDASTLLGNSLNRLLALGVVRRDRDEYKW